MIYRFGAVAVVTTLALSAAAGAADKPPAARADQAFLTEAASAARMEVELGRIAEKRASSEHVKQFAQRMVDDHSKVNEELKEVAARKSIALPATTNAAHRKTVDRLSKLRGKEFDRAYMQTMLKDHQEDVAKFRKEAQSADDPDVKQFATKTLATLESHLEMAKQISSEMSHATSGARRH
jgi:putative membrane protein